MRERILLESLAYISVCTPLLASAALVIGSRAIASKLAQVRFRLKLFSYFIAAWASLYVAALYLLTHDFYYFVPAMICVTGFAAQFYTQFNAEKRLRELPVGCGEALVKSIGHWAIILLEAGILYTLNNWISNFLTFVAGKYQQTGLNWELITWLGIPLTLYFCQLFSEFARTWLLRLQFLGRTLRQGEELELVTRIARKHDLALKAVYSIELNCFGYHFMTGHKSHLFLTTGLSKLISEKEFEFLVVRALLDRKLSEESQRLFHYSVFSAGLTLPYALAVQGVIYVVPETWIIPIWASFYGILFYLDDFLKSGLDHLQFSEKWVEASRLVEIDFETTRTLCERLNELNTSNQGPRLWMGLPEGPKLSPLSSKIFHHIKKRGHEHRRWLTPSARVLMISSLAIITISAPLMKSRHSLRNAAALGDDSKVEQMILSGSNPNGIDILFGGESPLLVAAEAGHASTVKILVDHGANPNQHNMVKLSPLLMAAKSGNVQTVKTLVEHGADVNYHGYKLYTPLMWAARFNHPEIVGYLISKGAEIDGRSKHLSTALTLAAQAGNENVVKILLEAGANPRLRDKDKDSVLDIAKRKKLHSLTDLILAFYQKSDRHKSEPRFPASK